MAFNSVRQEDSRTIITGETKSVFREMFTETGMETVTYYLNVNYGVNIDDAWRNPSKFQEALVLFLGDFGGKIILRRLVQRISTRGHAARLVSSENLDLSECVKNVLAAGRPSGKSIELTR